MKPSPSWPVLAALGFAGAVLSAAPHLSSTQSQPSAEHTEHEMTPRTEPEEYWTPERLRKAAPLPLPTVKTPPCPAPPTEESAVDKIPPVGTDGQAPEEER